MNLFKSLFSKKWEVVDSKGKVSQTWYKYKNARIYANDMNQWNHLFDDETFTVRRIGEDDNTTDNT
jgi:hypothetical protein